MLECPGCAARLVYPAQHATSCPAYTGHAAVDVAGELIACECGLVSLRAYRQAHIDDVKREAAQWSMGDDDA
jgi:hypothetical protein